MNRSKPQTSASLQKFYGDSQQCWEDCMKSETKTFLSIIKGPVFNSPTKEKPQLKSPSTLEIIAARAVAKAFQVGVQKSLHYLRKVPCSAVVTDAVHPYLVLCMHEWETFDRVERYWPWLDPFGTRIRRVNAHYKKLYHQD